MGDLASERPAHSGADEDPLVGTVIGDRYRIEAQLGRGGMGTVSRARHLALDRAVAIKLLHPRLTADPEVARRFDREALAASKLDHPNIVRVLDAGAIGSGARFIVMELLRGLAGSPPFDAEEPAMVLRMQLVADPPPLPDGVPAHLRAIVSRLLEKSPKDRFASAREVRDALEKAVTGLDHVPAAQAGASFGDAATAALAATPPPAAAVSVPPPGASAPAIGLPTSGVHRTVIATPAPMKAPPDRNRANLIVALVLLVTASAVIAYATLAIRDCASGTESSTGDAAPPAPAITPALVADPTNAVASPPEPATDAQQDEIPQDAREREKDEQSKGKGEREGKGKGKGKKDDERKLKVKFKNGEFEIENE